MSKLFSANKLSLNLDKTNVIKFVKKLTTISNTDNLKSIYFHSLMKYRIIFWGNSSDSKKVITLQKKIATIMMGDKSRNFCRDLFKRLQTLELFHVNIYIFINKLSYK
jgi:hypothetical protein